MSGGILVDSSVLLDVLTEDDLWFGWSSSALASAAERGPLHINPIILADVSIRFTDAADLDIALPPSDFRRAAIPWPASFLAGKTFQEYRERRDVRAATLPDFFVGAHAAVDDLVLLTRDARRFRPYFPTVEFMAPDRDSIVRVAQAGRRDRRQSLIEWAES